MEQTTTSLLPQPGSGPVEEYLDEVVRLWIGLPRSSPVEPPQLPPRLARLLLRVEEHENPHRDQWGCWEFAFSENFRAGRLWLPEVDQWVAERRVELAGRTRLEPLWPGDHPFVICLTHDVDRLSRQSTPRQVLRTVRAGLAQVVGNGRLNRRPVRMARALSELGVAVSRGISRVPATSDTLEWCSAIEQAKGVTSSYFLAVYPPSRPFPHECVYALDDPCSFGGRRVRVRDVARFLVDADFDVGLHGSYYSAVDASTLEAEKAVLEEAIGVELTTTRQHWLHWDARITPRLHEQAGFRSDSTLGFNRNVGFRAGTSMPFFHFDLQKGRRSDLVQVPIVIHDSSLVETNGLALDRTLAQQVIRQLLESVISVNGIANVLFHPDNLVSDDLKYLFEWTIDYGLERGAWITSVREIDRWWRERAARILEPREPLAGALGQRAGKPPQDDLLP